MRGILLISSTGDFRKVPQTVPPVLATTFDDNHLIVHVAFQGEAQEFMYSMYMYTKVYMYRYQIMPR